jgi:hypothetical protein
MAARVGDDGGGTVGGVEAEGGVDNGAGTTRLGMVRRGRGRRRGSGMTTGALPVVSRPKVGSEMGLVRWHSVEGGGRGTEGGDVDGVVLREVVAQRVGNLGSLTA